MRKYLLPASALPALLLFAALTGNAQEEKTNTSIRRSDDVIMIRPKAGTDAKVTVEIKGDQVKVNGKPLAQYKNDDVKITRRKQVTVENRLGDDMQEEREDDRAMDNNDLRRRKLEREMDLRADGRGEADAARGLAEKQRELAMEYKKLAELDAMRSGSRFRNGDVFPPMDGSFNFAPMIAMNNNGAFLGVSTKKDGDGSGVSVVSVSPGSAAEKAGLKTGDVLTKINSTVVNTPEDLSKFIGEMKPETAVRITYLRDKKESQSTAVLQKRVGAMTLPGLEGLKNFNMDRNFSFNFNAKPRLGLRAQETEDGKGLKVVGVDQGSAAEKAGLKENDLITSFDGTAVNTIDKLQELASPAMEKGNFNIQVLRDGKNQEIAVKIPKKLKSASL
jgi:serine protease Do